MLKLPLANPQESEEKTSKFGYFFFFFLHLRFISPDEKKNSS